MRDGIGTVLVVEDEPGIQALLSFNLESAGWSVRITSSAEEALRSIGDRMPDLALLDWTLPGASGMELTKRLRAHERTRLLPIIMLTARADERDKVQALDVGADDYMTKPFSPRELLARIGAVIRRRAPELSDSAVEVGGLRIVPATYRVTGHGVDLPLSPIDFRLLHFLMTHLNHVYTRRQLLDGVWGNDAFIEERTVDVHVRRMRSVLAQTRHDHLVETVRGTGYRMRG